MWGKIGGAGLGLAIGGPIGGLLGAFAGHILVDRDGALLAPPAREIVFTTGLLLVLEWLRGKQTIYVESEKRHRNVQLVDFENRPGSNEFQVSWEWAYRNGTRKGNRADDFTAGESLEDFRNWMGHETRFPV